MPDLDVVIPYRPRGAFKEFHGTQKRWRVAVCHRRAGKTVACINELIMGAMTCDKVRPRFAYIAPLLKQAKTVAWDYLKHYGLAIPGAVANESELRVDFPGGGQIRLYGADNPDGLRGIYLDGCVLDEAADMSPAVFPLIIRPALSDRKGWAVWIGTPKGQNDFYDLWQQALAEQDRYYTLMLRASQSGLVDPEELADARRSMSPEQYAQEYECSFSAAIIGAYYGREMDEAEERRVVPNLYDKTLQVHTAWDLGIDDQTAIWFYQKTGFEVRLIDFYSSFDFGLDHYARVLQDRGYLYGSHYLPHDVEVKELGTGRSRKETLQELGIKPTVVRKLSVEDGINAVRKVLPRCWFDRDKTLDGRKALKAYRREYNDIRKVFLEKPYHDWASDPADAFRYLAVSLEDPRADNKALPRRNMKWIV